MKLILMTCLFLGPILIGFGQHTTNRKLAPDFFYGTWTDSTKTGMTLKSDKEFLMVEKTPGSGFEDPKSIEGVRWTYNLFLHQTPIVIEIQQQTHLLYDFRQQWTGRSEVETDQELSITWPAAT